MGPPTIEGILGFCFLISLRIATALWIRGVVAVIPYNVRLSLQDRPGRSRRIQIKGIGIHDFHRVTVRSR